jgi:outer membrane protein OmpU
MKKLLMCSAAVALGLAVAHPAKADGIKLDLAGHFKGYVTWLSQDTPDTTPSTNERHFDILRETEIHFTGETTLDNGLTVGVHHEADIDSEYGTGDFFRTEESYAYFSGAWGRVNFGKEDGANYLLQVAAPSADENYDGLRQYINPENLGLAGIAGLHTGAILAGGTGAAGAGGVRGFANSGKLDYADDATGYNNKITYLTPVWSGFQAGGSYTPSGGVELGGTPDPNGSRAFGVTASSNGLATDVYGDAWEGGVRYEGKWQELGVTLGGGYTHVALSQHDAVVVGGDNLDAFNQWNLGAALTWQQFGLGGEYTKDNGGLNENGDNRTWDVGIDYTTGPFKLGASYLNNHEGLGQDHIAGINVDNGQLDSTRWAGGVVYTYGPGMTFRGSVGYVRTDVPTDGGNAGNDVGHLNATDVLLGTQINF